MFHPERSEGSLDFRLFFCLDWPSLVLLKSIGGKMGTKKKLSAREQIKNRLESGESDVETFLRELDALDQSTPERKHSEGNVRLLEEPSIVELIEEAIQDDPAVAYDYRALMSMSCIHVAQRASDTASAKEFMNKALEHAKYMDTPGDEGWIHYIEGTLAYLNKDVDTLRDTANKVTGSWRTVLSNLLKGLEETGEVDYRRDYWNV